jgi:hypothetical protein
MKEWNYKSPNGDFQTDWNQTLVTAINIACLETPKENIAYPIKIIVPTKHKNLIESLEYYNDGKLGDRFVVEFSDNIVVIGDIPLKVII